MVIRGFTVHSCLNHNVLKGLKNTSNPRDHHLGLVLAAEGRGENRGEGRDHSGLGRIIIGQRNTIQSAQFADKFKMATLDRESF